MLVICQVYMYNCCYQAADAAAQDTVPFLLLRQHWQSLHCLLLSGFLHSWLYCLCIEPIKIYPSWCACARWLCCWRVQKSSCFTGRTNIMIPRNGSDASTVRHCTSKEQYASRANGKEYTLSANAKLEIRQIYLEYSSINLGILTPGIY